MMMLIIFFFNVSIKGETLTKTYDFLRENENEENEHFNSHFKFLDLNSNVQGQIKDETQQMLPFENILLKSKKQLAELVNIELISGGGGRALYFNGKENYALASPDALFCGKKNPFSFEQMTIEMWINNLGDELHGISGTVIMAMSGDNGYQILWPTDYGATFKLPTMSTKKNISDKSFIHIQHI
jgi:hypothetical protein